MQITVDDISVRWVHILARFWEDAIVPSNLIAIKMGVYLTKARLGTVKNMYHPLIIEVDTQEKCHWLRSVGAEAAVYLAIQNEFGCKWGGHIIIMSRVQDDETGPTFSISDDNPLMAYAEPVLSGDTVIREAEKIVAEVLKQKGERW
jgi:hypothetical protein